MYHVACHVASHLYCLVFYMVVGAYVMYICEYNSVELQINLFIIIILLLIFSVEYPLKLYTNARCTW